MPISSACRRAKKRKSAPVITIGGANRLALGDAQQGVLVGRALADQRQELLRQGVARHRPKPGAGAAGENNGNDLGHAGHYSKNSSAIARLAHRRRESIRGRKVTAQTPISMIDRILTVGGFTLLSRVTGFVRDIMLAAVLGAGPVADAFFVALRLPNHFRAIFAEGAFNAAFVPAYARIREQSGADAGAAVRRPHLHAAAGEPDRAARRGAAVHAGGDRPAGAGLQQGPGPLRARGRAHPHHVSLSAAGQRWSRSTAASSMRSIVSPRRPRRRSCSTCR